VSTEEGEDIQERITKEYKFRNFDVAWDFMNGVAQEAKKLNVGTSPLRCDIEGRDPVVPSWVPESVPDICAFEQHHPEWFNVRWGLGLFDIWFTPPASCFLLPAYMLERRILAGVQQVSLPGPSLLRSSTAVQPSLIVPLFFSPFMSRLHDRVNIELTTHTSKLGKRKLTSLDIELAEAAERESKASQSG
jgi:pterin-4a-carbinolamine dehydratase